MKRELISAVGLWYTLDLETESKNPIFDKYQSTGRQFMLRGKMGNQKQIMKFLFGNQFPSSWIVGEDCPNKVECPLDLYKYSKSNSAKVF